MWRLHMEDFRWENQCLIRIRCRTSWWRVARTEFTAKVSFIDDWFGYSTNYIDMEMKPACLAASSFLLMSRSVNFGLIILSISKIVKETTKEVHISHIKSVKIQKRYYFAFITANSIQEKYFKKHNSTKYCSHWFKKRCSFSTQRLDSCQNMFNNFLTLSC